VGGLRGGEAGGVVCGWERSPGTSGDSLKNLKIKKGTTSIREIQKLEPIRMFATTEGIGHNPSMWVKGLVLHSTMKAEGRAGKQEGGGGRVGHSAAL